MPYASNFLLSDKEVNDIYNYLHKREEKVESKKCGAIKQKSVLVMSVC